MRTLTVLHRPRAAVVAALLVLVVLTLAAPAALAADRSAPVSLAGETGDVVKVGTDVYLAPGQTVNSLTVFGGDAIVAGAVRHTVVAVGGNVRLRDTARVGTDMTAADTTVMAIGGRTLIAKGATVTGSTGAWEDITSGQAVIAAAIAFVGAAIIATTFVSLALFGLLLWAVFTIAVIAGIVWLIVWLVRRENRRRAAQPPAAGTAAPAAATITAQTYVPPAATPA